MSWQRLDPARDPVGQIETRIAHMRNLDMASEGVESHFRSMVVEDQHTMEHIVRPYQREVGGLLYHVAAMSLTRILSSPGGPYMRKTHILFAAADPLVVSERLTSNYKALGVIQQGDNEYTVVAGEDVLGWSAEGCLKPRFEAAGIPARVEYTVVEDGVRTGILTADDCPVCGRNTIVRGWLNSERSGGHPQRWCTESCAKWKEED